MTATARGHSRPLGEAEMMERLVAAAHESLEPRLSQAEVDSLLDVTVAAREESAKPA